MRRRKIGLLIGLLLLIPAGYVALQLFVLFSPGYQYETAIQYTLFDGVAVEGVAVRSEHPLAPVQSAMVDYLVQDGSRVSAGNAVAEVFTSAQGAESKALERRLEQEIEMLGRSQDPAQTGQGNAEILLRQQQQDLYALLRLTDTGSYSQLTSAKSALTCSANKLQIATGRAVDFNARIASLTAQKDAAVAAVGPMDYVYADSAGYFSSKADGLEQTLTPAALDAMSAAEVDALIASAQLPGSTGAGRVMEDYQWYFYCVVDQAAAKRFAEDKDQKVTIDFHYSSVQEVPADIVSMTTDPATGKTLVKMSCTYVNADTVNLRFENVSVNFKSYSGLRIDAKAKHIVNGQTGVYVRFGNLVQFKAVTPVYESEQYLLVPTQSKAADKGNEVVLYDEIIVAGKNLYDGKLI